jgi:pimeloyl-ACP methyl ester carboxylesterase
MNAEPVTRSVKLPSGIRLPYAERGDPAGVPLLLLHGYTDSWRSFAPLPDLNSARGPSHEWGS